MARPQNILAINAKMYRHFAIVTVALTGGIAILADGEKREAVAQNIDAAANYEPEQTSGPKLTVRNKGSNGSGSLDSFYSSASADFRGSTNNSSSYIPGGVKLEQAGIRVDYGRLSELGLTKKEFDNLSAAERERALIQLNGGMTGAQAKAKIDQASRASLARSGGGESQDH